MDLFIIGNGFDIAHQMKTTYLDFRTWIEENYNSDEPCYLWNIVTDEESKFFDGDSAASFLMKCLDGFDEKMWKDFENMLGWIDWNIFQDEVEDMYDKEGDIDVTKTMINYQDTTSKLSYCVDLIMELFREWINSVESKDMKYDIFESGNFENFLYLTFNYTNTLEEKYKIKKTNIYHIHGTKNSEIVLGHNKEYIPVNSEEYNPLSIEADILEDLLRKPSEEIIGSQDFFDFTNKLKYGDLKKIFSWGFSFSDIDMIYFKHILAQFDTSEVTWYFNSYGKNEHEGFKEKLKDAGFKGKFDIFDARKVSEDIN